jgi:transcription antitermination factor NusG
MVLDCDHAAVSDGAVWYAAHVVPRHEKKVYRLLAERSIPGFFPTHERRSRWADRVKIIEEPLFPGYVFCRACPSQRTRVLTTPGVLYLVGNGRSAVAIDDAEIEAVRALVRSGLKCEPYADLIPGKKVRVVGGPLAGTEGIIAEIRKEVRLAVQISLLRRSVLADLDRDWVELDDSRGVSPEQACPRSHITP